MKELERMAARNSTSNERNAASTSLLLQCVDKVANVDKCSPLLVPVEVEPQVTTAVVQDHGFIASNYDDNIPEVSSVPFVDDPSSESVTMTDPVEYTLVHPHWFYCKDVEKKPVWFPFSLLDSIHLEEEHYKAMQRESQSHNIIVATDGGRYDVYLNDRVRCAVYWEEEPMTIRRATWFYRMDGDHSFIPYPEHFADKLEEEYCIAIQSNTWHRRLEFPDGETVVIHNPEVIVHYQPASPNDWEGVPEGHVKPRVVKRGMDNFENVDDGDAMKIDHLVFVVHGIGSICDLKFRTLPEAVADFRSIANSLVLSHFRDHMDSNRVGRVEFLPVSWHNFLHGDATGIDNKLKPITLKSIPKLRYFANDAILDVLFYTSPVYCQAIITQVGSELNRLYSLFLQRNPTFSGNISLAGHSLGTVILFDLLYHQPVINDVNNEEDSSNKCNSTPTLKTGIASVSANQTKYDVTIEEVLRHVGLDDFIGVFQNEKTDLEALMLCTEADMKDMGIPLGPRKRLQTYLNEIREKKENETFSATTLEDDHFDLPHRQSRKQSEATIHYMIGLAGTGHPSVIYPRLHFHPTCFFALGSPIAMFLTVRGHDTVWNDYRLPTCPAFYNIFHPYDPVAYRFEPLIDPDFGAKPVLIPHHKGRKRMHLEIRESLSRVGADLKQKVFDTVRSTWSTINEFARAHRVSIPASDSDVDVSMQRFFGHRMSVAEDDYQSTLSQEQKEHDYVIGQLNGGRRIDYVLQEKPIESFNEYIFALGSHTCYWESEDTVLLMLKEVYASYGIHPTSQGPDPPRK